MLKGIINNIALFSLLLCLFCMMNIITFLLHYREWVNTSSLSVLCFGAVLLGTNNVAWIDEVILKKYSVQSVKYFCFM